jgi:hypothetical protein
VLCLRWTFWEIKFINEHKSCYRDNKLFGLNILKESYAEYCLLQNDKKKKKRDRNKRVVQLTMSGSIVKVWNNLAAATGGLKIKSGNIAKVLKGINISAGGYKWRYE